MVRGKRGVTDCVEIRGGGRQRCRGGDWLGARGGVVVAAGVGILLRSPARRGGVACPN